MTRPCVFAPYIFGTWEVIAISFDERGLSCAPCSESHGMKSLVWPGPGFRPEISAALEAETGGLQIPGHPRKLKETWLQHKHAKVGIQSRGGGAVPARLQEACPTCSASGEIPKHSHLAPGSVPLTVLATASLPGAQRAVVACRDHPGTGSEVLAFLSLSAVL